MTGSADVGADRLYCGGTNKIRVGAGGVMLPNHSPLVIAEQFGTLASLYPDRIDLGLGRAPGSDQRT
ncbi:Luciferase-like monooxygenase family protein [Yersinia pseudotuberculosis]|nr:Luciferase-like monooxygenase family protein [Yersinia pseudotuberculosis]